MYWELLSSSDSSSLTNIGLAIDMALRMLPTVFRLKIKKKYEYKI